MSRRTATRKQGHFERHELREGPLRTIVLTAVEAYLPAAGSRAEHLIAEILHPVPHRPVVPTIPRVLRGQASTLHDAGVSLKPMPAEAGVRAAPELPGTGSEFGCGDGRR